MSLLFCGHLLWWPRKMTGLSHLIFASDEHPTWLTCFSLLPGMQAPWGGGWPAHRGRPTPPLLCVGVPLCLASGHRSAGQEETGWHGLDGAHPTCPGLTSLGTFSALRIERKMPCESSSCVAPGSSPSPSPMKTLEGTSLAVTGSGP